MKGHGVHKSPSRSLSLVPPTLTYEPITSLTSCQSPGFLLNTSGGSISQPERAQDLLKFVKSCLAWIGVIQNSASCLIGCFGSKVSWSLWYHDLGSGRGCGGSSAWSQVSPMWPLRIQSCQAKKGTVYWQLPAQIRQSWVSSRAAQAVNWSTPYFCSFKASGCVIRKI